MELNNQFCTELLYLTSLNWLLSGLESEVKNYYVNSCVRNAAFNYMDYVI